MKNKPIPTIGQKIMNIILPYETLVKYEALGQNFDIISLNKAGANND